MKQYLFNYLKKNKIILIVFGALYVIASILLAFMSLTIANKSELHFLFVNKLYLIFSAIFLMVATVTFSYFANSTHFFKNKEGDGFQLDEEKRNKHNNLFMLFSSLIIFFVGFILYIIIVFIRQSYGLTINIDPEDHVHIFYNFEYFIPVFIVLCLYGIVNYTITTFLITRSNNFIGSIIYLVMGQLALTFLVSIPLWFVSVLIKVIIPDSSFLFSFMFSPAHYSSSMIGSIPFIIVMFFGLIEDGYEVVSARIAATLSGNIFPTLLLFICLLAYIVVGVFSYISLKKEKEGKVSLFGSFIKNNIIHISFVIVGLCIGYYGAADSQAKVAFFVLMSLLVLSYYPLESLIKGTFKLSKKEIIAMSIICVAIVTINFLTYFTDLRFIHL